MSDVLDLIAKASPPKKRQATTDEILTLSSGGSQRTSASSRKKSSTSVKSPKATMKSSGSSGSAGKKKPCKYGPRGADGYCPKKPKSSAKNTGKARTRVTAATPDAATKQATDVILNPKATSEQKVAAVGKVAEVTATETVKSTIRKVATPANIAKLKKAAKEQAPKILELATKGVVVAGMGKAYQHVKKETFRSPKLRTLDQLKRTEQRLKRKLTKKERDLLTKQYMQFFTANPDARPV